MYNEKYKKHIFYFLFLLGVFIVSLKFQGAGFRNIINSTGPLEWKEILMYLPKYIIFAVFVVIGAAFLDSFE